MVVLAGIYGIIVFEILKSFSVRAFVSDNLSAWRICIDHKSSDFLDVLELGISCIGNVGRLVWQTFFASASLFNSVHLHST